MTPSGLPLLMPGASSRPTIPPSWGKMMVERIFPSGSFFRHIDGECNYMAVIAAVVMIAALGILAGASLSMGNATVLTVIFAAGAAGLPLGYVVWQFKVNEPVERSPVRTTAHAPTLRLTPRIKPALLPDPPARPPSPPPLFAAPLRPRRRRRRSSGSRGTGPAAPAPRPAAATTPAAPRPAAPAATTPAAPRPAAATTPAAPAPRPRTTPAAATVPIPVGPGLLGRVKNWMLGGESSNVSNDSAGHIADDFAARRLCRELLADAGVNPQNDAFQVNGLTNGGNTCWLNSVIQLLRMDADLRTRLPKSPDGNGERSADATEPSTHVAEAPVGAGSQPRLSESSDDNVPRGADAPEPLKAAANTRRLADMLFPSARGVQQDAIEGFQKIIDILRLSSGAKYQMSTRGTVPREVSFYNNTAGRNVYMGYDSDTSNRATILDRDSESLETPDIGLLTVDMGRTVQESLEQHWNSDEDVRVQRTGILENGSSVRIEGVPLKSQTQFVNLPPSVTIGLKRFNYGPGFSVKNTDLIRVQPQVTIPSWNEGSGKYTLDAFIVHLGDSAHNGHYVSCVRDPTTQLWYVIDDDKVNQPKSWEQIQALVGQAYMLHYSRSSDGAGGAAAAGGAGAAAAAAAR